jgi:prophage DNA circulation protein
MTEPVSNLPTGSPYWSQLKPASFRGLRFGVTGGVLRFGRRNAIHEYPFRDTVWVEDLGRSRREIHITGFLVGDDVIARRDALIAAAERSGDGELVHPTLGARQVALIECSSSESVEGRVFELQFVFVEQGARVYPAGSASAAPATAAADDAQAAANDEFADSVGTRLQSPDNAARAQAVAAHFAARARGAGEASTMLFNMSALLQGNFGVLLRVGRGLAFNQVVAPIMNATLNTLTGRASAARVAISSAIDDFVSVATAGNRFTFPAAAMTLTEAVRAAAPTPGDAILAMLGLAAFTDSFESSIDDEVRVHDAVVLHVQRAAATSLIRAAAEYRPASAQDALAVRDAVSEVLDAQISLAGQGSRGDAVFVAMRTARSEIVKLLNATGAQLPQLITVQVAQPMPSLVLAQRLYRDAGRSDELIRRAAPAHPAFMPLSFEALSE